MNKILNKRLETNTYYYCSRKITLIIVNYQLFHLKKKKNVWFMDILQFSLEIKPINNAIN